MRIKLPAVLLTILVSDQLTKLLFVSFYPDYVFFNKSSLGYLLVALAVLIFLIVFQKSVPVYLIISGGISNILDRVLRGGVVDFISLPLFPWKFNLADMSLTLGVIWFIYDTIIRHES